jgi:uncharacterized protein (DUF433 family)
MANLTPLSKKSTAILEMIASGWSYAQIVDGHPDLTYLDIFGAAREALELARSQGDGYPGRLARIREQYPRAYEPWAADEESRLLDMSQEGRTPEEIARELGRQPSAIRSRLVRLGAIIEVAERTV